MGCDCNIQILEHFVLDFNFVWLPSLAREWGFDNEVRDEDTIKEQKSKDGKRMNLHRFFWLWKATHCQRQTDPFANLYLAIGHPMAILSEGAYDHPLTS